MVSRRITVVADSVAFPTKNRGVGSQLTLLYGICTVTVHRVAIRQRGRLDGVAVRSASDGCGCCRHSRALHEPVHRADDVIVRRRWPPSSRGASKIATRAPSREAFVKICWTMIARPNSIIPNIIRKNTGATRANSTAAAPCRFLRQDRQPFSSLTTGADSICRSNSREVLPLPSPPLQWGAFLGGKISGSGTVRDMRMMGGVGRFIATSPPRQNRQSSQSQSESHKAAEASRSCARRPSAPARWDREPRRSH